MALIKCKLPIQPKLSPQNLVLSIAISLSLDTCIIPAELFDETRRQPRVIVMDRYSSKVLTKKKSPPTFTNTQRRGPQ